MSKLNRPVPLAIDEGTSDRIDPVRANAKSVVAFIAENIRQGLLEGHYVPGQRLIEADLTAELGVSRGPVREGLRSVGGSGYH